MFNAVHNLSIEEFNSENKFNVIIASHIFPYVNIINQWKMLDKIISLLEKDGLLIIFEMTKKGIVGEIKNLILQRNFETTDEHLIKILKNKQIKCTQKIFNVSLSTKYCQDMLKVIMFFCEKYENKLLKKQDSVFKIIKQKMFLPQKRNYEMKYTNKMIIITK